jgi:imidazolonepropionase-like amidohydrolase
VTNRLATAILLLASLAGSLPAQRGTLTIRAEKLYVGDGTMISPALVSIENGKIVAVTQAPEGARSDAGLAVVNAVLTPGFVEGTSSAGLPKGLGENEEGSEVTACVRAASVIDPTDDAFRRMREVGVTTMIVTPGNRNVIGGLSVAVKARDGRALVIKEDVALHAVLGNEPAARNTSPRGGSQSLFARRPNSRMGVIYEMRRALQEGCERNENLPMGKSCFCEADGKVLAKVMKGDVPIGIVAHAEQDILTALNIADEFKAKNYYLQGAVEAYLQRELLARRGIPVLIGPVYHSAQLVDSGGGGGRRRQQGPAGPQLTDKGGILGGPKLLKDAGVRFALSEGTTDLGATLLDYAQGAVRGGLSPADAIAAISGWPAAIVGLKDKVGVIAPGRDADLNLFAGDPLSPTSRLMAVIIDGEVVYRAEAPAAAPDASPTAADSRRN